MAVIYERLPDGRYRVYRDFHSLPAATHAATLLEGVSERAFIPVERASAVAPDPAPPADFHVGAQSGAVVDVE